jgi:hypothetical protein
MPNRYIRASAIESESVNALTPAGEVFFRRLLNRVDDFGRFHGNAALLRASLFPLQLDRVTEAEVLACVKQCEQHGLLFTYEDGGKQYVVINKWEQGRANSSTYPQPDANTLKRMKTFVFKRVRMKTKTPDSDSDSDSDTDSDPTGGGGFLPPTEAEWLIYAHESAPFWPDDAALGSYSHYVACGWRMGEGRGKPVKVWRSCVTNCARRWRQKNSSDAAGQTLYVEDAAPPVLYVEEDSTPKEGEA